MEFQAKLRAWQRNWAAQLRQPELGLADKAKGMSCYRRLYWNQHHKLMHEAMPLTRYLLGESNFHQLVRRYLLAFPSQHYDLNRLSLSFAGFLRERKVGAVEFHCSPERLHKACEAAHLEKQLTQLSFAKIAQESDDQQLLTQSASPWRKQEHWFLWQEQWPLLRARQDLLAGKDTDEIGQLQSGETKSYLVLRANDDSLWIEPLPQEDYALYQALTSLSLQDLLEQLASTENEELAALTSRLQHCLKQGVDWRLWLPA